MNWLDIAFLVTLVALIVQGWRTGVHWAFIIAGGALAGVFAAGRYQEEGAQILSAVIASQAVATFIAFALVLLATLLLAIAVGWVMRRILGMVFLGWVDNLVGALLGLAVGLALVTAFTVAGCRMPLGGLTRTLGQSAVAQNLSNLSRDLLPQEFGNVTNHDGCGASPSVPL